MKPAIPYPRFARQRIQIISRVEDISEEIRANDKLFGMLTEHTQHMLKIINVLPAELFPPIFAEVYSSLSKYSQVLSEINCKFEAFIANEIRQWNGMCTKYTLPCLKPFIWDTNEGNVNENSVDNSVLSVKPKPVPIIPAVTPLKNNSADSASKNVNNQNNSKPNSQDITVNEQPKQEVKSVSSKNKEMSKPVDAKTANDNDKNQASVVKKETEPKNVQAKTANGNNKNQASIVVKNAAQPKSDPAKTVEVKDEKNLVKENKNTKPCSAQTKNDKPTDSCNKSDLVVPVKVIEDMKLPLNTKYKGNITFVVSPMKFYIQFVTKNSHKQFERFKKDLELHCKNYQFPTSKPKGKTIEIRKQLISQKLGDYALVYLQPAFHRVKIVDWNLTKNDDRVTVDLLDMGSRKDVCVYNLHPIPEKFMEFPAFASRCHLGGVPEDECQKPRIVDFFRGWVNKTKRITVEIQDDKNASLAVVVYDDSSNSVNELVVAKIRKKNSVEEPLEGWDPMSEAFKSNTNMYDFDVDDPAASIYGYVGKDYDRVCKFYGNTGKCFKTACRKEHVLLDSKGFTTDKEEVYIQALNPLKIPKVKMLNVRVTHVESPSSFYCILDNPESDTVEESLRSLLSYMNQSQNISEMKKMLTPPAVGQVVIAQSPGKESWFRARVVSVLPEKDECTLFYVDHGRIASLNFSCIRAMEPRYLHLPFQAIFCEICGVGDQQGTFNLAVTFLTESLKDVSRVEVVSTLPGEPPHLLVNLFSSEGENMAQKLLLHKLVACKENIHLDDSKIYVPG